MKVSNCLICFSLRQLSLLFCLCLGIDALIPHCLAVLPDDQQLHNSQLQFEESAYSELVRHRVFKRGEDFRQKAKLSTPVLQFVGIGAGPFNAVYTANRLFNEGDSVILEATKFFGIFDQLQGTFQLNSEERHHLSGNLFVGSPIQLSLHNLFKQRYPDAVLVSKTVIDAFDYAQIPVLFNEEIYPIEIEPERSAWPARYRLTTQSGLELYTSEISLGIGQGKPKIHPMESRLAQFQEPRLKDESLSIYHSERKQILDFKSEEIPTILTSDDFLYRCRERKDLKVCPLIGYAGKRVIVIGGGHGAMTAILRLIGVNDTSSPSSSSSDNLPARIHWVGFQSHESRLIYQPLIDHPRIQIYPHSRAISVQKVLAPSGERIVRVVYETQADPKRLSQLEGDFVISAYGYSNQVQALIQSMGGDLSLKTVLGFLPEKTGYTPKLVGLGKQLYRNGEKENIYVIGSAYAYYLTPGFDVRWEELGDRPGTLIELLSGRTAALAISHQTEAKMQLRVIKKTQAYQITKFAGNSCHQPLSYPSMMEFRKEIARRLSKFKVDSKASSLILQFSKQLDSILMNTRVNNELSLDSSQLIPLMAHQPQFLEDVLRHKNLISLYIPLSHGIPQYHFMREAHPEELSIFGIPSSLQ